MCLQVAFKGRYMDGEHTTTASVRSFVNRG